MTVRPTAAVGGTSGGPTLRLTPSARAFGVVTAFLARAGVTRARVLGLVAFAAVGVIAAAVSGDPDPEVSGLRPALLGSTAAEDAIPIIDSFVLLLFVPIAALLFATASFGDLVEDGTLVYLWLRPVRRWVTVVAATTAALGTTLVAALPVAALVAVAGGGGPREVGAACAAATVAVVAYVPVFVALGLGVRRSLLWGLAYVLIWEGVVVPASDGVARVSARTYSRSVLEAASGVQVDAFTIGAGSAVIAGAAMGLVGAAATLWLLRHRDVP